MSKSDEVPPGQIPPPHGAGHRFGRNEAKRRFEVEEFREAMRGRVRQERMATELLDEAPMAYKDIGQVMADQADLVKVEHELHAIVNYKGTK